MLKWNTKIIVREDWGTSRVSCVLSKDGKYRRCKITSNLKEGGAPKWGACHFKKFKKDDKGSWLPCETLDDGSPKYYKDEDAATLACDLHAEARQAKKNGKVEGVRIEEKAPSKPEKTAPEPEKTAPEPEKTAPEPEKTPKPEKKTAKKSPKPSEKKPGVFKVIIDVLKHASPLSPITKGGILEALKESFPDREEEGMKATINTQVPSGLRIRKGLIVEKNDRGYWLP